MEKSKANWSWSWLARYRPYPMVMLSGLLLVLAFPPLPLGWLSYVALVPLLLVIDQTPERTFEDRFWGFFKGLLIMSLRLLVWPLRVLETGLRYRQRGAWTWPPLRYHRKIISRYAQVFRYAFTTFVIWNLGTTYWLLLNALNFEEPAAGLAHLGAGLTACLVNPFLMTLPFYFYLRLRHYLPAGISAYFLLPLWLAFEWLHYRWVLAWPWLTLGHSLTTWPAAIQYAEWTGVGGISALILLVNILCYRLLSVAGRLHRLWLGALALALVIAPLALRPWLLDPQRPLWQPAGTLGVRLVQPNLDPETARVQAPPARQLEALEQQVRQPGLDSLELVILPERVLPRAAEAACLYRSTQLRPFMGIAYAHGLSLLTGFTEIRPLADSLPPPPAATPFLPSDDQRYELCAQNPSGAYLRYNAAVLICPDTAPQVTRKQHLVPLMERSLWPAALDAWPVPRLPGSEGDFAPADTVRVLRTHAGTPLGVAICLDALHGRHARRLVQQGAEVLVILTYDGWWLQGAGYRQHAWLHSLRAIETRRSVVRLANAGLSLWIDPQGYRQAVLPVGEPAVADLHVPRYTGETFYQRHGDWPGRYACWLSLGLLVLLLAFEGWAWGRARQPVAQD